MNIMKKIAGFICVLLLSQATFAEKIVEEKKTVEKKETNGTEKKHWWQFGKTKSSQAPAVKKKTEKTVVEKKVVDKKTPDKKAVSKKATVNKKVESHADYWSKVANDLIAKESKRQNIKGSLEISQQNAVLQNIIANLKNVLNKRTKVAERMEDDVDVMGM